MKKIIKFILAPYYRLRAIIAYERAVEKCEESLALTGQRTYIVKGAGRKLILVDRSTFRKLKLSKVINRHATISDLQRNCLYCTSYLNGKDPMPPEVVKLKRKEAIQWLSAR